MKSLLFSILTLLASPSFAANDVDMVGKMVLINQTTGMIHHLEIKPDSTATFSYALAGVSVSIKCDGVAESLTKKYGSGVSLNMECGVDREITAVEILVRKSEQVFFEDGKLATVRLTILNDGFPVTNQELDIKRTSK